jgi:hypothetical protein
VLLMLLILPLFEAELYIVSQLSWDYGVTAL